MKPLTDKQKRLIKGGKSVGGIMQGLTTLLHSASIILGYISDYLMYEKFNKNNKPEEKKFFNDIEEKNSILS